MYNTMTAKPADKKKEIQKQQFHPSRCGFLFVVFFFFFFLIFKHVVEEEIRNIFSYSV